MPFKRALKPDLIDTLEKRRIEIHNHYCTEILMMGTTFWGQDYPIQFSHQLWVAEDLTFSIPNEWQNPPYIITMFDHRIAFKMIELGETPFGKRTGYTRELIAIESKPLDQSIFEFD